MSFSQPNTFVFFFIVCFKLLCELQNIDCAIVDKKTFYGMKQMKINEGIILLLTHNQNKHFFCYNQNMHLNKKTKTTNQIKCINKDYFIIKYVE